MLQDIHDGDSNNVNNNVSTVLSVLVCCSDSLLSDGAKRNELFNF